VLFPCFPGALEWDWTNTSGSIALWVKHLLSTPSMPIPWEDESLVSASQVEGGAQGSLVRVLPGAFLSGLCGVTPRT
jgi:hypothetical protein